MTRYIATRLLIAVAAGLLCLSCTRGEVIEHPERTLTLNRWVVRGTVVDTVIVPADTQAFLEFSSDGILNGSTGCHKVSGRFDADTIAFRGSVAFYEVVNRADPVCDPSGTELSGAVTQILKSNVTFTISGNFLTLVGPENSGLWLAVDV